MTHWTEEDISTLKELHKRGLSGGQIARKIGGITRNAVIGKLHRLGLSCPKQANPSPLQLQNRIDGRKRNTVRRTAVPRKPKPRPAILPSAAEAAVSHIALNVALLDLTTGMCRWPTSEDRPHLFCGIQCESGSYCSHHKPLATIPIVRKTLRVPTDRGDRSWKTYEVFEREAA